MHLRTILGKNAELAEVTTSAPPDLADIHDAIHELPEGAKRSQAETMVNGLVSCLEYSAAEVRSRLTALKEMLL